MLRLGAGVQGHGDVSAVGTLSCCTGGVTRFYLDLREGALWVRRTGAASGRRPRAGPGVGPAICKGIQLNTQIFWQIFLYI